MRSHHHRIAAGAIGAAIGAAPHAPARLVDRRRLIDRRLHRLGIGQREGVGHLRPLGGEADRRSAGAAHATASVDERIEHQVEELAAQLERTLLRAGRGFARQQRKRVGEIAAGEAEDGEEAGRQRAAVVEERVDGGGDALLVAAQPCALPERGGEVQQHVGRGVAQADIEARDIAGHAAERGAAEPPAVQDGVIARRVGAGREERLHAAARERRAAGDVGDRAARRVELHDVERARLERKIARHGHRRAGNAGRAGRERAAVAWWSGRPCRCRRACRRR